MRDEEKSDENINAEWSDRENQEKERWDQSSWIEREKFAIFNYIRQKLHNFYAQILLVVAFKLQ